MDAISHRARRIVEALCRASPADRAALLLRQAGPDASLIAHVQELMAAAGEPLVDFVGSAEGGRVAVGDEIGRYVVEKRLGHGGMAEVWAVRHRLLGTHYALKLLTHATPTMRRRLLSEGRAQARLQHGNIVPVWDIVDVHGVPGLLMMLVRGPSLRSLLQDGPLATSEALWLLRGIVDGVEHAHHAGLVHRDLKPANVLLDLSTGTVAPRVADFGLVMRVDGRGNTLDGAMMGTPAYAAPEMLRDAGSVTAAADRFSLGVMFVEVLAGHRPYAGADLLEVVSARQQPPDLSGLREPMRSLAARLLDADPARRPAWEEVRAVLAAPPPPRAARQALAERAQALSVFGGDSKATSPSAPAESNLPSARDVFIGREEALSALVGQLSGGAPLVTLLGPGGVGKTRLALEAGRSLQHHFSGGVWFCDAAEARDKESFQASIARALSIRLGSEATHELTESLRGLGPALLILDNLEQVLEPAAGLVSGWLGQLPELVFLCTSRAPLRIRAEQRTIVQPMAALEGAALFTARARVRRAAPLSSADQADIAELVELLDGLPLAIELAAARCRLTSPARLRARLSERFKLLAGRAPDRPERQQTLWKTLQWSWELLESTEQQALAQLSVFEGGFTIEAAEAVVALEDEELWIEDVLDVLADNSWLALRTSRAPTVRLGILRSIQDFAAEKLGASRSREVEVRHGRYFAQQSFTENDSRSRDRLLTEAQNALRAFQRAVRRGDDQVIGGLSHPVARLGELQGPMAHSEALLSGALQVPAVGDWTRFELCYRLAHLRRLLGQRGASLAALAEAQEIAERTGDPGKQRSVLILQAYDQLQHGQLDAALASYRQLLAFHRRDNAVPDIIVAHNNISIIHMRAGRLHDAMDAIQEALSLARAHNFDQNTLAGLLNLAQVRLNLGQLSAAHDDIVEALPISRRMGDRRREASLLRYLGLIQVYLGHSARALPHIAEALELEEQLGAARNAWVSRTVQAQALAGVGRYDEALALLQGSLRYFQSNRISTLVAPVRALMAEIDLARGDLGGAREAAEDALERARSSGNTTVEARTRLLLSQVHHSCGDLAAAIEVLRGALALPLQPFEAGTAGALLADCLAEAGEVEQARAVFAQAAARLEGVERGTDRACGLLARASVARACGEDAEAQRVLLALDGLLSELSPGDSVWLTGRRRGLRARS